jgi:ABC-type Na+ efflux pump permease subunit
MLDIFGDSPSADALKFFDNFAMVLGTLILGLIFLLIGSMSFKDEAILRRLCFLYSVVWGFFCIPDLVSFITNDGMAAPLPVAIMGIFSYGLLLYGSKKGTV